MSETIAEMVLPGTYIEVRSEGLIGVSPISTGNIGIVGTSSKGPVNEVKQIGNYADAVEIFGPYDSFASPTTTNNPLTLVRALQLAYQGGAKKVFAVRVANGTPVAADLDIASASGPGFTLTAKEAGSYGNLITAALEDRGASVTPRFKLTLTYRNAKETFEAGNVADMAAAIDRPADQGGSRLVDVGTVQNGTALLSPIAPPDNFEGGNDQAAVTSVDLGNGLAVLEDEPINILLIAGAGSAAVRGIVAGYLERTENNGKEQIAVLGATASGERTSASGVVTEAEALNDDRIVLVAPGLVATDAATGKDVKLPPPYLAAVVAGKLSTLSVEVSLTNKALPIDDLDVHYTSTLYESLLNRRMLLVRKKFGMQVVKGITTDNGAFKQISVRRIVDYAKAGVRSGADAYIGRLNNARVRAALKATLDGFLSQMVLEEKLVGYELDVTATRTQEINGICSVVMTLLPTFSIDYIRVTMNLK